ncbi:MAG: Ldh family oxidoreductase [Rhodospirillales bacterium]|nr:Ldh family oxidoreductase [Rhodospirillales bacterium]
MATDKSPAGPDQSDSVQFIDADAVRSFVGSVFAACGLSEDDAGTCADGLVEADLRGVWSHGVARVPMYVERLVNGVAKAAPDIRVERVAPAAALVDGDDGLGLVVAPRAMDEAITIAQEAGVGLAGVRNSGHFGMAAVYAKQAVAADCLGFVHTNASAALPPWGGARALLGTNPFAFSAPTGDGAPFLIDMAMSNVARGKLKFAAQRGEAIPEGLALDKDGQPTTDGAAAFEGVVLPFGGVKGAALSWMNDVLGGVFTGAAYGGDVANPFTGLDRPQNVGHVMIAMRADLFMPLADFEERMTDLAQRAKGLPKAEGFESILAPGEPEELKAAHNRARGIPLTADVRAALQDVGVATGVDCLFGETV